MPSVSTSWLKNGWLGCSVHPLHYLFNQFGSYFSIYFLHWRKTPYSNSICLFEVIREWMTSVLRPSSSLLLSLFCSHSSIDFPYLHNTLSSNAICIFEVIKEWMTWVFRSSSLLSIQSILLFFIQLFPSLTQWAHPLIIYSIYQALLLPLTSFPLTAFP